MNGTLDPEAGNKITGFAAAAATDEPAKTNTNAATAEADDADASQSSSNSSVQEKLGPSTISTSDMYMWKQLELEKSKYPGASTWAPDEERLFELLFFRQDLPILPSHWGMDLSNVPISEANFADAEHSPVVYAHSKDFLGKPPKATNALVRLIELTAAVRTTSESGLHHRVPGMVKDGLDRFLAWAAEDGGYLHRRVVPNVITEVVDTAMPERAITELLQGRMRALARLQREFLREDRDPNFWRNNNTKTLGGGGDDYAEEGWGRGILQQGYLSPRRTRLVNKLRRRRAGRTGKQPRLGDNSNSTEDELTRGTPPHHDVAAAPTPRRRTFASGADDDDLDELSTSPVKYRRPPPVVYGFFILDSSVFILTADASLGDQAYVSFHVEADFMEHRQSVWNALTLAMVACLARDEMRERADDFEPQPEEEDSDPDL
ncbi:hypothetical protein ISF_05813 [Cordyceps fumosorosea ARSEF 2679]|uniref:Uncharacterized protein n=1 Tax=Cordyceps fumosorosea (strain ARSEF 2679) TaxID=1081104 RepID=A0A167TNA3_CORFA|nr:hypothetical protein ISF_05813 [Cordyceps fumosorosea ARSEF 2679]OAA60774.1 hypothetical protein ISF_05813 [Cordyceps fumosorosea ARSEF 2679]